MCAQGVQSRDWDSWRFLLIRASGKRLRSRRIERVSRVVFARLRRGLQHKFKRTQIQPREHEQSRQLRRLRLGVTLLRI